MTISRIGALFSLTAVCLLAVAACSTKPSAQTWSCVLSDAQGKTTQCFTRTDEKPADAHAKDCDAYEIMPGGKKAVVNGACPTEGMTGDCVTQIGKESLHNPCYGQESCEKDCASLGGTFTKK